MTILKWICFIFLCADVLAYVQGNIIKNILKVNKPDIIGTSIGLIIGLIARIYVLYGTVTCWILA